MQQAASTIYFDSSSLDSLRIQEKTLVGRKNGRNLGKDKSKGDPIPDVMRHAPAIYEKHKNRAVGAIVLHAGINDIKHRQSEILKADFAALIKDTKERTPSAKIFISGPLSLVRRSNEYYSCLLGLNNWLQGFCKNQDIEFINNWDLFWERSRFFMRDGLHPNSFGAQVLSENISKHHDVPTMMDGLKARNLYDHQHQVTL
uniref:SGNH hydrolase-type esterase domain-containing protein n=1 Tax=Erpetoichthys calabaricus TaxID=27687 RepID=A0A8C4RPN5_ERPCA